MILMKDRVAEKQAHVNMFSDFSEGQRGFWWPGGWQQTCHLFASHPSVLSGGLREKLQAGVGAPVKQGASRGVRMRMTRGAHPWGE